MVLKVNYYVNFILQFSELLSRALDKGVFDDN